MLCMERSMCAVQVCVCVFVCLGQLEVVTASVLLEVWPPFYQQLAWWLSDMCSLSSFYCLSSKMKWSGEEEYMQYLLTVSD